ncbi:MAG: cyclic nucleotide-binding domain-containing protein [Devosiaceae bacterium]|nr:cyclic nucleotide-binding domain-containing protein [Devosiaceae bacterium MH13]
MFAEFNWTEPGLDEFLILLFNFGNLLAVIAFAVRGPITLRALAVLGTGMQAIFYAYIDGDPIWFGLFWKVLMAVVALSFMLLLIYERMGRQFAPEVRPFVNALDILTPGQLQRLIRAGEVRRASSERGLLLQGQKPTELYYLLAGRAQVLKDGKRIDLQAEAFLGEISFISGGAATADVVVQPGAVYLAWSVDELNALLEKEASIDIAVRGLMNHDLARKVASQPLSTNLLPAGTEGLPEAQQATG